MMNQSRPKIKELLDGLNSYLINGYVNESSPEDPEHDAFNCLNVLYLIDKEEGLEYCKLILDSDIPFNDSLRSTCLYYLLLSENDWKYAFTFLLTSSEKLSVESLKEAFFYFYCAKNETDPHPVPEGLFKKLISRYQELKDDLDANFYHLHETYNDFIQAYALIPR